MTSFVDRALAVFERHGILSANRLDNYDHRRLHSSIGDQPPISRVHNVRG